MGHLLGLIAPLAVGAALSPTILGVIVLVLSGPHGRARAAVFLVGNVLVVSVLGTVLLVLCRHAAQSGSKGQVSAASAAVDVALGIILLLLAMRAVLHHGGDRTRHPSPHPEPRLGRYAAYGVAMMLVNISTLALFIPAVKDIAVARVGVADEVLTLAGLVVAVTVTAWGPLLLSLVAPATADRVLAAISGFVGRHGSAIAATVLAVFGAYLLIKGLDAWPASKR
jgi:Sap, sulfolipid-1-addressing protein